MLAIYWIHIYLSRDVKRYLHASYLSTKVWVDETEVVFIKTAVT